VRKRATPPAGGAAIVLTRLGRLAAFIFRSLASRALRMLRLTLLALKPPAR